MWRKKIRKETIENLKKNNEKDEKEKE